MTTYRLVPVEASEEMLNAGYTAALPIYRDEGCEPNPNDYRAIWKAMLQAAPLPQNELLEAETPGATEAFSALDVADRLIERAYGTDVPLEWGKAIKKVAHARAGIRPTTQTGGRG